MVNWVMTNGVSDQGTIIIIVAVVVAIWLAGTIRRL